MDSLQRLCESRWWVLLVRLRGRTDLGTTFVDVLARYAAQLDQAGSRLVVASVDSRVMCQLHSGGVVDIIGPEGVVIGDERVGAALASAVSEAQAWIDADPDDPATS